jgi:cytochrome c peroxidase
VSARAPEPHRSPSPRFLWLLSLLLLSCAGDVFNGAPQIDDLALDPADPVDNGASPAKIELGRLLFWDPILSGERDVACATCHHPAHGYADARPLPIGTAGVGLAESRQDTSGGRIPLMPRNTPTLINVAFNGTTEENAGDVDPRTAPMMWDTRLRGLEEQALEPLRTRSEMRGDAYPPEVAVDSVVARLRAIPEYVAAFKRVFADRPPITAENVARAMAAFERSLVARESRFDRYARGEDAALTQIEKRGLSIFLQAACYRCHSGPMFSDYRLHVLGVAEHPAVAPPDEGGGDFAFRTPTLRNLSSTAPYMHNGTQATLEDVVRFYAVASSANPHVPDERLDPDFATIIPIDDDMVEALVKFLRTLDDDSFDQTIPERVPSGLPVGGSLQ